MNVEVLLVETAGGGGSGAGNYLKLTTIYTGAGSHSVKYPNIYHRRRLLWKL